MNFVTKIALMKGLIELLGHKNSYDEFECKIRSSLIAAL